ncbi:hypothetical protein GCM10010967_45730 [Dyadobacter beijingensis]|uniref:Peptidase M12B domain-containing protein n=1 Tax=Dyadobacter beijingensis TaxID=365489 RepID=A0ABQ2IDB8_9BACT|nr:zinc-dependent metalloprotease [Dyadobacter beijingensis]GGN05426.1 hypothetical protein GCM10010967_45730 [Dyadobacter beijingensis]
MKASFFTCFLFFITLLNLPKTAFPQSPPTCGTSDSLTAAYLEKISKRVDLTAARTHAGEMLEYRLAVDINYQTAKMYGHDQEKIRQTVYDVFAETSAIFEREMNIKLTITYIHIWQQPEPYALVDDFDYFSKILDYWERNRREERDAVVSLSARSGTFWGGFRMCTSNFPGPGDRFTVDILAHELGHTLGSPHTHSCAWPGGPIDRCAPIEYTSETCPAGRQEFVNGSIMSYCRSKLTFHPLCRNLIREFSEGRIVETFSLKPYAEKPTSPGSITVYSPSANVTGITPSFEWQAAWRAKRYRFQIATDEAFTRIVEDTVTSQSFYRSPGMNEGSYFARYLPENDLGGSNWSTPAAFRVNAFSEAVVPSQPWGMRRDNSGIVYGSFRALEGVSAYQVQFYNTFDNEFHERSGQITQAGTHHFAEPSGFSNDRVFYLRYRVSRQGIWSQWSAPTWFETPVSTSQISLNSDDAQATAPILAIRQWVPYTGTQPFTGLAQIATDSLFRSIVFEQSFTNNSFGDWATDKELLLPSLSGNTTYFMRSRMLQPAAIQSEWAVSRFRTGVRDNRFRFLGTPSKVLHTSSYRLMFSLYNRFVKSGDKLYVFNFQGGYHLTTDLQSWQSFLPSTTNGRSSQVVTAFGASPDGNILLADPYQGFLYKTGDLYQSVPTPDVIYFDDTQEMIHSEQYGYFLKNSQKLIIQFYNGGFYFHRNRLPLGMVHCMAKDSKGRIWVMGDAGAVWRFENNEWAYLLAFPYPANLTRMAFDDSDNCFIYGDFGVSRLAAGSGQWELIADLQKFNVKKLIFDDKGTMWLASYRLNSQFTGVENVALIKYAYGKTTAYTDGLNFLHEPFDLEFFKDQLLIMTTGGEIHAFDERQILSFVPKQKYCPGEPLDLSLATNSSFGAGNKISAALRKAGTNQTITWQISGDDKRRLSVSLPDSLPQGNYSLAIQTTSPEITSHPSAEFTILPSSACGQAQELLLLQNKPNPIGTGGSISFYLPRPETVNLELFNLSGQKISDLKSGELAQGWHSVDVNSNWLAPGLYVYRLKAGKQTKSLRMMR